MDEKVEFSLETFIKFISYLYNMTQKLWAGVLGGTGIVAVLFIIGIILSSTKIETGLGNLALWSAVAIGIIFGLLGIVGILKRLLG